MRCSCSDCDAVFSLQGESGEPGVPGESVWIFGFVCINVCMFCLTCIFYFVALRNRFACFVFCQGLPGKDGLSGRKGDKGEDGVVGLRGIKVLSCLFVH